MWFFSFCFFAFECESSERNCSFCLIPACCFHSWRRWCPGMGPGTLTCCSVGLCLVFAFSRLPRGKGYLLSACCRAASACQRPPLAPVCFLDGVWFGFFSPLCFGGSSSHTGLLFVWPVVFVVRVRCALQFCCKHLKKKKFMLCFVSCFLPLPAPHPPFLLFIILLLFFAFVSCSAVLIFVLVFVL